ncbi:hypothetical protein P1J78_11050 [Psychromarinibacter sp. C21-152]|uniref:Uncharacterized protein n=1 Tax=Psychromarinibacter sediminicola TaxID=3033385 RepID=A0AAE3T8Y6_9RHOB|nr:hypothetical protein [Psychromarinibacter sediminicola]MDF0601268.1 hypothetical protein [Psychromarinibacter sediminicola]
MTKSQENIKRSQEFIQRIMKERFGQDVPDEDLERAARDLCDAIPGREKEAA